MWIMANILQIVAFNDILSVISSADWCEFRHS
jgi:hypothetical protein